MGKGVEEMEEVKEEGRRGEDAEEGIKLFTHLVRLAIYRQI